MRNTSAFLVITALLTPFVAARMHHSAVCITYVGEAKVYAEETTKKACEGYHNRDTGDEKWDKCPDCQMVSGLSLARRLQVGSLTSTLDVPGKYERMPLCGLAHGRR